MLARYPIARLYNPAFLAGLPPAPIRRKPLGVTFPSPPANPAGSGIMEGFVSKPTLDSIVMAASGAGLAYLSKFFPGIGEPIGLVAGLGLLGVGGVRFYNAITGAAEPEIRSVTLPPNQTPEDVYNILAEFKEPKKDADADVSSRWSALFGSQRTFKLSFSVTNRGSKVITAQIAVQTQQFSRPVFGQPDTQNFTLDFLVKDLAPGEARTIDANYPLAVFFFGTDINASIVAKSSAADPGKILAFTSFQAGVMAE